MSLNSEADKYLFTCLRQAENNRKILSNKLDEEMKDERIPAYAGYMLMGFRDVLKALVETADKFYADLSLPPECGNPPMEVKRAVVLAAPDWDTASDRLWKLRPYGGYWGFSMSGMFVGIEPNGYMHT